MLRLAPTAVFFVLFSWAIATAPTHAASLNVNGDSASAVIQLPGNLRAKLTIRFDQTIGLTPQSLGYSVAQINPLSPGLINRLPNVNDFSIPSGFPVMISIDPPAADGLSFEGVAEIELYTTNLHYLPGTPLRLFSSSDGEDFRDITEQISAGSYRVRGSTGRWSDFLIVADLRTPTAVVNHKFSRLQNTLTQYSAQIDSAVYGQLNTMLSQASMFWNAGNSGNAIKELVKFETAVETAAAAGRMPAIWRSARDIDNVAGELIAEARTLRFSLGQTVTGLL